MAFDPPQDCRKKPSNKHLNLDLSLATDAATIGGIRRRDKKGRLVSRASRIRGERTRLPDLNHRKSLFPDGEQRLAWSPEAAYPLGVYLLRKEIEQKHFHAGQIYSLRQVQLSRILGAPRPMPRTIALDPSLRGRVPPDGSPTPIAVARAETFRQADALLRSDLPLAWWALQLCLLSSVMGKVSERYGASAGDLALPSYTVSDLIKGLETAERRRLL